MKKQILLALAMVCATALGLNAQLLFVNDGAQVVLQPGAVLTIEGDFENKNGGTFDNDGRMVLHGDFINSATYDGADPHTVAFVGAANSEVTAGGAVFDTVEVGKDADMMVQLLDDMTIGGTGAVKFTSEDSYVSVGGSNLVMQDGAIFQNADSDNFVVTGGTGYLRFEDVGTSETVNYPVGYNKDSYNPVTLASSGSNTNDDYDVRVLENVLEDGLSGSALTEGVVDASWEINEAVAGGSDVDVTVQWAASDELMNFDNASNAVSRHDGSSWDLLYGDLGAASGADPYTRTKSGVNDFSVFAVGGQDIAHEVGLALKAFLAGPFNSGAMRDSLRADGLIPNIEPYSAAPYNYSHVGFGGNEMVDLTVFDDNGPDNSIVDWIVVELRDSADSTTVLASKTALIQRDGDIVDLDGTSALQIPGVADGDYIVALRHRNHLGVRTPESLSLDGVSNTPWDFTTGQSQAYEDLSSPANGNTPMKALSGGVTGLYAGDVNIDGEVKYNGSTNDRTAVLQAVGFFTPNNVLNDLYAVADVNMDSNVKYNGSTNDRTAILSSIGFFTPNNIIYLHD